MTNREELFAIHRTLCDESLHLMKKKNHDYAYADDPFANFRRCEDMGITTTDKGFLVRLTDKLSRLSNFSDKHEFKVDDEKLIDTCMDIINYVVLFFAWNTQESEAQGIPEEDLLDPN